MTTFVLVHGAWSGAHGLRHVRHLLQREGHEVFTPSLTGIGERVHLASPLVTLSTHVRDVTNQILYEDLRDIVLMGFSYGGFVIAGALEFIADRVAHLVFVDAFVPAHGDTVLGQVFGTGRPVVGIGEEWLLGSPQREFDDEAEGEWVRARRTPQPKGSFTEPVYLARPLEEFAFTRTYVKATLDPPSDIGAEAMWRAARTAQASPAWAYREIPTTHMVPSNRPADLAAILLDVVAGSA